MSKNDKKIVEIKGSPVEKVCVVLQLIVLIGMVIAMIYTNVNNIESGFITKINDYGLYVVIILLLIPMFFGKKR